MFLVIPLVEFLHVLDVDINVHHENPATFLCHVSVSSVKRSRHRFASPRWHPVLSPGETRDSNWGAILVQRQDHTHVADQPEAAACRADRWGATRLSCRCTR